MKWCPGSLDEIQKSRLAYMTQIEPSTVHHVGRDQHIQDYLLQPSENWQTKPSVFCASTAVPCTEKPWDFLTFWILFNPCGSPSRMAIDHPRHTFVVLLPHFDITSNALPPPPTEQIKVSNENLTLWERLLE